jgi:adenosine deaminase
MPVEITKHLTDHLIKIISETNGIALNDTLQLSNNSNFLGEIPQVKKLVNEFRKLLNSFQMDEVDIKTLIQHPVSTAFANVLKKFPMHYKEEHIHLTGSLTAEFIYPRLKKLLEGPHKKIYEKKITDVYGAKALPIKSIEDVNNLIRLQDHEAFDRYLEILLLAKLILVDKAAHKAAAYSMASELYNKYNVGQIRLKFTLSRTTSNEADKVPGSENVTEEDVVLGLYDGFMKFKKENPKFNFVLSPCFRKEADFFDNVNFKSKKDHFQHQINTILHIIDKHPHLTDYVKDVDTVGNERDLYRKGHFAIMQQGFRKLHYRGFSIRSHHGETWHTLRKGVQAVDNSLNIWHIDTLEHGLSLGINPNYYYHSLFQRIVTQNWYERPIKKTSSDAKELEEMQWHGNDYIKDKLLEGIQLTEEEVTLFVKAKFHAAREVEHYQHDVLNRMINKGVSLIALPTSNNKLTGSFPDYKDHPFSWWEKKGVDLGIGTDNYITLNTDYIQELLILLYTDPDNLKITKLLMIATGENRRPYLSHLLWSMRENLMNSLDD